MKFCQTLSILFALLFCSSSVGLADAKMFASPEQLDPLDLDPKGAVKVKAVSPAGGVVYPGESVDFKLQTEGLEAGAAVTVEVVRIGSEFRGYDRSRGNPMIGGQVIATVPRGEAIRFEAEVGEEGTVDWSSPADAFEEFGVYAVIAEVPEEGRRPAATFARVHKPHPMEEPTITPLLFHKHHSFDMAGQLETASRLGYRWVRTDGFPNWNAVARGQDPAEFNWTRNDRQIDLYRRFGLYIQSNMYGSPRGTVSDGNWEAYNYVHDPEYDPIWGDFVEEAVRRYNGPDGNGPLQIIDYWNEPWEGGGISAWKSDSRRYRQLYEILYRRAHAVSDEIMVGGASSIMNTVDKFFIQRDWRREYGFDILTDHYVHPFSSYGPRVAAEEGVFSIETETWLGYDEHQLVAVATQFMAAGQRMVNPNHTSQILWTNGGKTPMPRPVAASASTFLHFVHDRELERVVFQDHLPWLYQYGVGTDAVFLLAGNRQRLNRRATTMYDQIDADGRIIIDSDGGRLEVFDVFGNSVEADGGSYDLPLDYRSFYLEHESAPALIDIVRQADIRQVAPVEIFAEDFVRPFSPNEPADVRVEIHNVLNRAMTGTLAVFPAGSQPSAGNTTEVALDPGEYRAVSVHLALEPRPANAYPLTFRFSSDAGSQEVSDVLHVNAIHRGTPEIDGHLGDWNGSIPVLVHGQNVKRGLTEAAWLPFEKEEETKKGIAEIRCQWDDRYLYVAVRSRNAEWQPKPSLTQRKPDEFFGEDDMSFTYTAGRGEAFAACPWNGDMVQVGVNLGLNNPWLAAYEKAPERLRAVADTDYEYGIWKTRDGEPEFWRSGTPDIPTFHYFPRCMPDWYDGTVPKAKSAVRREGNVTIYEVAIPLGDMPELKPAPGRQIHLTFALPGSGVYFGAGRTRTRDNGLTLRPTWQSSPSNEVRWGFVE